MKPAQNKCLGFVLPVSVPDSVEEFDKLAGRPGAALDEAVKNILYRSWNNEFRSNLCDAIEKETGVKRELDKKKMEAATPKKDGTVTNIYEQEAVYIDRVLASGFKKEQFTELAQVVASKIEFDPSEGERGGGRIGKEYLAAAEQKLAQGEEKVNITIGKLEKLNPGLKVERDGEDDLPTKETLARAIKVNADRKTREALAEID